MKALLASIVVSESEKVYFMFADNGPSSIEEMIYADKKNLFDMDDGGYYPMPYWFQVC